MQMWFRRLIVVAAFAGSSLAPQAMGQARGGKSINVPPMPATLQVPSGNTVFLHGYAEGTQNYICQTTATGFAWRFLGPQATLFVVSPGFGPTFQQLATHFLSPNPVESGIARATWQSSSDTSAVWAAAIATSTDSAFVEAGAIPWLLLQAKGVREGTRAPSELAETTYIQRLRTRGGVAPSSGCTVASEVGALAFVPYTTDYFFYKASSKAQ